jgi:hypothetical protein
MCSSRTRALLAPARLALLMLFVTCFAGCIGARSADAADYRMLLCAGNVGAGEYTTETNTTTDQSSGIFELENNCGPAPIPAGNAAYLRIAENQASGMAGNGAFGRFTWTAPEGLQIASAGGYTREPYSFNEGWRARYWLEGFDGSANNVLVQGSGITEPTEVNKPKTTTFAPHLWPFPALGSYRKFNFEVECVRQAGCDRSNYNAADSNTMLLTLDDPSPPVVMVGESPLTAGRWVKGPQSIGWATTEAGSGLRFERLRVDGGEQITSDFRSSCDIGTSEATGEYARSFEPCPRGGPIPHSAPIETASLADGSHSVAVCAQDFAQAQGIEGTGGETCETRAIRTDNTAPAAPLSLSIGSVNAARYEQTFSASWGLAPDPGSPVTQVRYWITGAAGNVVVPVQTVAATNPTGLPSITGPATAGDYHLNVQLVDEVGFVGATASAAIPHDTTPPAAPQDISVTPPSEARAAHGFDVSWTNIVDDGSPISAAHYDITDQAGNVVVGEQTITAEDPQSIEHLATPQQRGAYELHLWLSDAEGNVGAPVSAPLSYECVRSEAKGAASVSATFGAAQRNQVLVPYGSGAVLGGHLRGGTGQAIGGAPICVYSRIVTGKKPRFLGIAISDSEGSYQYPIAAGASREIVVENRPGQRTIRSAATLVTRARPSLRLVSKTPVHNKTTAVFVGKLPGPDSGSVSVVLQIKDGTGWTVFGRATTRADGSYKIKYKFTQTFTPVTFTVRTQMPPQKGVPYHSGSSELIAVPVRPGPRRRAAAYRGQAIERISGGTEQFGGGPATAALSASAG